MGVVHWSSIDTTLRDIFPPLFHTDERTGKMAQSRSLNQVLYAESEVDLILFTKKKTFVCVSFIYSFELWYSMDIKTPERGKYSWPVSLKLLREIGHLCVDGLCTENK